jgi:hypothetical protein
MFMTAYIYENGGNACESNLNFRVRFMPIAAAAGGIRFARDISISLCNLLCRPCPHDGLNANRKY